MCGMILRFKMGQDETDFCSFVLNLLTSDIYYLSIPNYVTNEIQILMDNPVSQHRPLTHKNIISHLST